NQRPLSMPLPLPSYIVTPPPDYMMTPTALLGKKLDRCRSMLVASTPREEDGKEDLPDYSCTVYKMGYVYIKKEYDMPHVKAKWRRWRKLYVELWGTVLKLYRTAPKATQQESTTTTTAMEHYPWLFRLPYQYYYKYYYCPIVSISLAGAEAARALDYFRRPNVLRLTTQQGPQLLMKLPSHVDMISWIEHLQAAINISLDLEQRPMPKFITIQTRGLASNIPDSRAIALERAREQRRRDQHEVLI
ncbi:hypothetical protein BDF20DRAFT_809871, partial [Mycotypha africana]|uniref:uncharacterized protein n=1 Tax=Mycotypha africana TaxID=64632 RepID=UPI0022FFFDC7